MTSRTVLVTGGGGFLGGALVSGFADLGWDVVAVDRDFDGPLPADRVRRIVADLGESPEDLPGADVVIHAAWVTADPASLDMSESEYIELNLRPLLAMVRHAKTKRPASFVFISSSGVFAATDGVDGLHDRCRPSGSSAYAKAKLIGERLAVTEVAAVTDVHVVRLGYLYGPGESARPSRPGVSLVSQWLNCARRGDSLPVRADDPRREWTFAADVAPVLAQLVSDVAMHSDARSATNVLHVGSPHVIHDSELAEVVAGHFTGVGVTTVAAGPAAKPPMIASDVPAIRDFEWTDPVSGIDALVGAGAVS